MVTYLTLLSSLSFNWLLHHWLLRPWLDADSVEYCLVMYMPCDLLLTIISGQSQGIFARQVSLSMASVSLIKGNRIFPSDDYQYLRSPGSWLEKASKG